MSSSLVGMLLKSLLSLMRSVVWSEGYKPSFICKSFSAKCAIVLPFESSTLIFFVTCSICVCVQRCDFLKHVLTYLMVLGITGHTQIMFVKNLLRV